jgi:hypothetical protein
MSACVMGNVLMKKKYWRGNEMKKKKVRKKKFYVYMTP